MLITVPTMVRHNPFEHNGIKVFNGLGYKLSDALEDRVEEKILSNAPMAVKKGAGGLPLLLRQHRRHRLTHTISQFRRQIFADNAANAVCSE